MHWYGWVATATLGALVVGAVAALLPERRTRSFWPGWLWVVPALAMIACTSRCHGFDVSQARRSRLAGDRGPGRDASAAATAISEQLHRQARAGPMVPVEFDARARRQALVGCTPGDDERSHHDRSNAANSRRFAGPTVTT
jgi:hypothetical protein